MRRLTLALALAISPFVTRVARAQDSKHDPRSQSMWSWLWRDNDDDRKRGHDDDKKCEERRRGHPSEVGRQHRADPTEKGHKDCDKAPPPSPAPPPPTSQDPPPSPPQDPPPPAPVGLATISGSLFHDLNTNAVFDPDEIGLAGWTLVLTGPVTQTVLSDGNGFYSFTGLPAGAYTLCVSAPMGWNQTLPTSGTACTNSFGYSITVPVLAADVEFADNNFGFLSVQ